MTPMETELLSTMNLIQRAWPVIITMVLTILWLAEVNSRSRRTQEDFKDFKEREYEKDKADLLGAIRSVQDSQERSEEKLEAKLDQMATKSEVQLNKLYDQLNQANFLLAEVKGRLYPKPENTQINKG